MPKVLISHSYIKIDISPFLTNFPDNMVIRVMLEPGSHKVVNDLSLLFTLLIISYTPLPIRKLLLFKSTLLWTMIPSTWAWRSLGWCSLPHFCWLWSITSQGLSKTKSRNTIKANPRQHYQFPGKLYIHKYQWHETSIFWDIAISIKVTWFSLTAYQIEHYVSYATFYVLILILLTCLNLLYNIDYSLFHRLWRRYFGS